MAAGYRSYTAFWEGGAGAPSQATGGYRSYLAFWIGGAGASVAVAEPPTPSPPPIVDNDFSALFGFSGGNPFIEDDRDRAKKVWLRREDEEIMIIISCL